MAKKPKRINTTFKLKKEPSAGGRTGEIRFGNSGIIQTPALFPALCIMTGPPGFGRNGAHYKYIKRILSQDWRFEHFLTEILHFSDYMGTKTSLQRWLNKSFQEHMDIMMEGGDPSDDSSDKYQGIPLRYEDEKLKGDFDYSRKEKPYEACFFLDSGGFKLLSNSDFSIEQFGYPTNPKSILELQTAMGGDIVASLDYPLPPVEYDPHTLLDIQKKSLNNALKLIRFLSARDKKEPHPLAYLAIHGIDYETSKEYTEKLLRKLDKEKNLYTSFGFAIGSLVPRRSNRALVASIIKGFKDAIHEHRNGHYNDRPVHAFGMAGDILPTLAYLGVDTFDSNSYVQHGKNLRYILPHSREFSAIRETRSLLEINADELRLCGCRACEMYLPWLEAFKELSGKDAQGRHRIKGVEKKLIKSEVYTFLALHSLEIELRELDVIRNEISKNRLEKYVLKYAEKTNNKTTLLRAYEAATGKIVERPKARKVSISLTRESFAIPDSYKPPHGKEILLFLPCTKDKPYKKSRTHEAIRSALHKDDRIHIVTISGLYGPVPEELEEEREILEYDYMLTPQAAKQIEFVQERLVEYMKRYGNQYKQIFAYATSRAYREVARLALKEYSKGKLLPAKVRERTMKEFLRTENIKELKINVGPYLIDSTFMRDQTELPF